MKQFSRAVIFSLLFFSTFQLRAQQLPDNDFAPAIARPIFEYGKGPLMVVDAGHHNFHTIENRFAPFGKLATMSGFQVKSRNARIDKKYLENVTLLVIANALNEKNINSWQLPVHSAFTADEIKNINHWVRNGGSLFLIADHMPFAGAVSDLAQSMGFSFYDGFAMRKPRENFDMFSYSNGMLMRNELTGLHGSLDSIISFTGQAFTIPDNATSVITLDSSYKVLLPEIAWEFDGSTKMISAEGLSQLAYCKYGSGKIVMAGEAAMFTAQKVGDFKVGMNASYAPHNVQLLLNIFEWLTK